MRVLHNLNFPIYLVSLFLDIIIETIIIYLYHISNRFWNNLRATNISNNKSWHSVLVLKKIPFYILSWVGFSYIFIGRILFNQLVLLRWWRSMTIADKILILTTNTCAHLIIWWGRDRSSLMTSYRRTSTVAWASVCDVSVWRHRYVNLQ